MELPDNRADEIFRDITSYLDFVRAKGYEISVCGFSPALFPYLPTLYQYEVHTPEVCVYLKSCPEMRKRCIAHKAVLMKCLPKEARYGCCYAGVEEYLIPIFSEENEPIVCINVSGYRGNLRRSFSRYTALRKKLPAAYEQSYEALSPSPPDPKEIRTVTAPLFYMFRALYAECRSHQAPEDVSDRIYRELSDYFYAHYPQADVFHAACRELHYSEAYLRRLFRQKSGKPPNAFLTQLRVKRAAELLRSTDQPVTRIAAACGFDDPNYFSALFHNWYGMPPRDYRKKKNTLSP